ncbi:MAG: flagellar hook assembly protein FlgD [Phycisphaerae bacterium]
MDVSGIGGAGAVTASPPSSKGFEDLKTEDFFALMIAELQAQDPLKPTDNQQLFTQMSQVRQIEQSVTLNRTLQSLAGEQRFGATTSLIGQFVAGRLTNDAGNTFDVQGVVVGVRFEGDGKAILDLHNGTSIPADKVNQVTLVENLPPDVLDQIQAELAAARAGNPASDAAASNDPATAKSSRSDATRSRQTPGGDAFRELARGTDTTAAILDSILSPGVSVGL